MGSTAQRSVLHLFSLLGLVFGVTTEEICVHESTKGRGFDDPCCFYPCENRGVCISRGRDYVCDCAGLSYFGRHCHRATWGRWFRNTFLPSSEGLVSLLNRLPVLWHFVSSFGMLNDIVMHYVYQIFHDGFMTPIMHIHSDNYSYMSIDAYFNCSTIARDLPPVPLVCPTATGYKGGIELPPISRVMEKVLIRDHFRISLQGTNMLFFAYAQYFLRQLKTDTNAFTCCNGVIDVSQIYSRDENFSRALRSFRDGELKVQNIHDEEYPPYLKDVLSIETEEAPQWALVDPVFNKNPWLFVIATIWLREHNRVCRVLKTENPSWDDERLYQTARLIITGEMIKVTMSDYLQHLGQYNLAFEYKPELLHDTSFQYSNRVPKEFHLLHHWQAMEPDSFHFLTDTFEFHHKFDTTTIPESGLDAFVKMMVDTITGEVGFQNYPNSSYLCINKMLQRSREMRLQPFNNYRRAVGMEPYKSFLHLTEDPDVANVLEELYEDVDAVEFFIGVVTEGRQNGVLGPTGLAMATSWTLKVLMSNPIGSPGWWKSSTFGGEVGMNMVKQASLHSLFCNNLKTKCKDMAVKFSVPNDILQENLRGVYEMEVEKFVSRQQCVIREKINE